MANIHPPILHNLLRKEMSLRSICHLPYPIKSVLAGLGKNNLKFIIIWMLLFPSHIFPSHLTVSSFIFHILLFPLVHPPPLSTLYNTTPPNTKNMTKTTERKKPAVPTHKNLSFCILPFHRLLITSCQVPDTHALNLVKISRCYYNTNSITINNPFK